MTRHIFASHLTPPRAQINATAGREPYITGSDVELDSFMVRVFIFFGFERRHTRAALLHPVRDGMRAYI